MKKKGVLMLVIVCFFGSCNLKNDNHIALNDTTISNDLTNVVEKEKIDKKEKECNCFDGIGSSDKDKPILVHHFLNGKSISVCGFYDEEIQSNQLIMSEFAIFDCETGKNYVEFGATQTCAIKTTQKALIIEELKYLPVGTDWKWEFISMGEQQISEKEKELIISEMKPKILSLSIDKKLEIAFLNSLKRNSGMSPNWEEQIGKLEVLALNGNEKAMDILKNYETFFAIKTDGALAETWKEAIANVEWMNKK